MAPKLTSIILLPGLFACSPGQPDTRDVAVQPFDTVAVVTQLAGCYELQSRTNSYVVRLTAQRTTSDWAAHLLEKGSIELILPSWTTGCC